MSPRKVQFVLIVSTLWACGGGTVDQPADPVELAFDRSHRAIETAIERGRDAEELEESISFQARFNPVDCDCPSWEILYRGQWVRVLMRTGPESTEVLDDLAAAGSEDLEGGGLAIFTAIGRLTNETTEAFTGVRYRVFLLSGVDLP